MDDFRVRGSILQGASNLAKAPWRILPLTRIPYVNSRQPGIYSVSVEAPAEE